MASAFLFPSLLPQISLLSLRLPFNPRSSQADPVLICFATSVQVNEGPWGTAKYAGKRGFLKDMQYLFSPGQLLGYWEFSPASYL